MSFALDIRKFAEKAMANADQVVRKVTIDAASGVVGRSPVGNPELWAANAHAAYGQANHNLWVGEINRQIDADPDNFTKSGNLKRSVKRAKRAGKKTLNTMYPMQSGKGYVGGRFRANWQFGDGAPNTTVTDEVDPSGAATMARLTAAINATGAGGITYLTNSLPYGPALEDGHSTQSPAGMVGITVVEFTDQVRKAVSELDK